MTTLALLLLLFLQTPSSSGAVEGIVLGVEGRPVEGAEVLAYSVVTRLYRPGEVPRAVSGADGRFTVRDLAAGGYRLFVSAPGYVSQEYGTAVPSSVFQQKGEVLTVVAGQVSSAITMRLTADAIVGGRLTSDNGVPLVGMQVYAMRRVFDEWGVSSMVRAGPTAETNDRGEFRLAGLPSGRFYLAAESLDSRQLSYRRGRATSQGDLPPADPSPGRYAARFYPGVSEAAQATPFELQPGARISNLNMVLPRVPSFRIHGRVVDPTVATPRRGVIILLRQSRMDFSEFSVSSSGFYKPDGTFELVDLVPGLYWLGAYYEMESAAGALVTVTNADADAELTLVSPMTVTGKVSVNGSGPVPTNVKVDFRNDWGGRIVVGSMTMGNDGAFTYKDITPGEYRVTISALPPDFYIKEARMGGVDALTQSLLITEPPKAPLEITLARGTSVRGTVAGGVAKQVVLIPAGAVRKPQLYRTAVPDASGTFAMTGVAPGDYRVYAWKGIEPFQYFDPDFMGVYEDAGIAVTVGAAPLEMNEEIRIK